MKGKAWLDRMRIVVYVVLVVVTGFVLWRYDLVRLPSEGCSPLVGFAPGDRLVVERRLVAADVEGEAVLYRAPTGELLLGRVSPLPPSAPPEHWAAVEAGALWLEVERRDCPGGDSRRFGPIETEAAWGRVAFRLPW